MPTYLTCQCYIIISGVGQHIIFNKIIIIIIIFVNGPFLDQLGIRKIFPYEIN